MHATFWLLCLATRATMRTPACREAITLCCEAAGIREPVRRSVPDIVRQCIRGMCHNICFCYQPPSVIFAFKGDREQTTSSRRPHPPPPHTHRFDLCLLSCVHCAADPIPINTPCRLFISQQGLAIKTMAQRPNVSKQTKKQTNSLRVVALLVHERTVKKRGKSADLPRNCQNVQNGRAPLPRQHSPPT